MIDASSANLADSIREINVIEVGSLTTLHIVPKHAPQPLSLRRQIQHAYTKSVATIWIVDTPLIVLSFILGKFPVGYIP